MNSGSSKLDTRISILFILSLEIMCFSNLVVISPNSQATSTPGSPHKANTIAWQPTYTRQQLIDMGNIVKLDNRYSKIPFETINMVRKFKINKHPSKLEYKQAPIKQTKVNSKNLINIQTSKENTTIKTPYIRTGMVNTRSIKNKVELVLENSILENLDILAITETWLKNNNEDQAWIATSGLDNDNYTFHTHSRIHRRGGGICLLHKQDYQAKKIDTDLQLDTMKHALWEVIIGQTTLAVLVIYHPH